MSPHDATVKAMGEVTSPMISITLVLLAVFIPTAFLSGISGETYRQFALTIAATALISAINALTLKPAQCAAYLKARKEGSIFDRIFNFFYWPLEHAYAWTVRIFLKVWWLMVVVFIVLFGGTAWWYDQTPTGFLPEEDQGYVIIAVKLPEAASLERTKVVADQMNKILSETPGIDRWVVLGGLSLLEGTQASNAATAFVSFKDWSERTTPELQQQALVGRMMGSLNSLEEPFVLGVSATADHGFGCCGRVPNAD